MKSISQFFRLFYIYIVMMRNGMDRVILSARIFSPIRFLSYLNPWNWGQSRHRSRGEAFRLSLEQLGPLFVKFGQMLSTRRDLIPPDIADELAKLQDAVPPFSSARALKIVEKTYKKPVAEVFQQFDIEPLASASVAQVHAATLSDGKNVVVKILRPGIRRTIQRDVSIMYSAARFIERFWKGAKRLHPVDLVAEFEKTILNELNLQREAANASQLRRNFLNSDILHVPEVYWDYTHLNILVMERISGVPISDIETLHANGVDCKLLAERGVEIFFTQVFRDSFFHADMHPGNIFVDIKDPKNPSYIAVDFGIMGSLEPSDQRYIAENMQAFFKRDYRRVATLHVESGWVAADTRITELESAIRTVCEPIFEKPLKDISFGYMFMQLLQTAAQFKMEVQPQLMLLQKTMLHIEGLGRQLYPDLDLWETAAPHIEHWVKERYGVKALGKKIFDRLPEWIERLPELPDLIYEALEKTRTTYTNEK